MSTPEPYPYRQLNYPINNLEQSFSQEQKLQTRANIGIPSSVNNTDKVLTVDDAAGELAWKEVEIPEVPVQDVEVDGQSVVNENGVAEITMPTIPVTDVTVNGTSVVSNTVAAVTVPTAVSDLQNDVGYITASDVPSAQTQSDWDESDSSDPSFIQNKPTPKQLVAGSNISISESLSTVTISAAEQVNADWDAASGKAQILHKPDLSVYATTQAMNTALAGKQDTISDLSTIRAGAQAGSTAVQPSDLATVATTGDYDDLSDKPDLSIYAESSDLATVATTGSYDDLVNKPSIPPAQVNADWDASSGVSAILNKPNLAAVATTGDYSDLVNTPSIPDAQVNSDWSETDSTSKAYIENKPDLSVYAQSSDLATVATTGSYDDLSDKPVIPAAQIQSDWTESDSTSKAYIQHKPDLSIYAQSANLATVATTGDYADLDNTPSLATVATTGDYSDLTNKPSIPAAQVNSDWDAQSGVAQILNKPNLATVATSGNYNDLTNKPTIPPAVTVDQHYDALSENPQSGVAVAEAIAGTGQVPSVTSSDDNKVLMASFAGGVGSYSWEPSAAATQVNADWDANSGVAKILNKPDLSVYAESSDLAAVATSGDYNDLQNRPSIPAAQVNADWGANSGVAQILNKPNLATVATSGDYADLANKPTIPAAQVQSNWNESDSTSKAYIQNKPDLSVYAQSANLATVATSGDYADLSNKPTIPAAQVQSNWNESDNTSKAFILNKPDLSVYAQSANLATVATTGDYDDLENKPVIPAAQIQADWNETNTSSKAYIQNKPTIPAAVTVDQTYDASSTNPQSGTAVAEAVASISVDEVPAVTSSDDGKVLKATYSGGTGSYSWETETGATYTAGDAIDITNNEISVNYDTNTLGTVYGTASVNVTQATGLGNFSLPAEIQALAASANPSTVTVHLPANTLYILGHFGPRQLPYRTIPLRIMLGASDYRPVDEDGEFSQLESIEVACTYDSENDYTWVDGQDITIPLPCDSQNGWSSDIVATRFTICADTNYADPYSDIIKIGTGMSISNPIVFSYQDASAPQKLAVKNPLPASTSADADKVLKVDANGVPEWSTGGGAQVQADWTETDTSDPAYIQNKPATTGLIAGSNITLTNGASGVTIAATVPTTDQVYNSSSTNPQSGTAVAGAISNKQNKLYSINDVRVVSSLPTLPVSTTLYLIPET